MRPVGRTREAVRRRKSVLDTAHCRRVRPTLAGTLVGNSVVRNGNAATIAAAINCNMTTTNSFAVSVQPLSIILLSGAQEVVGNNTENLLKKK